MTTITNKREKIESRRDSISKEEKQYILSKTHRRCAHCGQKLTIDSEKYTTDHFIPISKSGTNQTENLVPLCYDCNQLKGDYIVHPEDFYKHVSTHYMRELIDLYKEYCSKYKWATKTNYTKATLMSVSYLIPVRSLESHKRRGGDNYAGMELEAYLFKATADDVDDIVDFVAQYNQEHDWESDKSDVRDIVNGIMKDGCIYIIKRKGEFIGAIPMQIDTWNFKDIKLYGLRFCGLPFKYKKWYYKYLLYNVIITLIKDIITNVGGSLPLMIGYPVKDDFINELITKVFDTEPELCEDDKSLHAFIPLRLSSENRGNGYNDDDPVKPKDAREASDMLQKLFDLTPINQNAVKEHGN